MSWSRFITYMIFTKANCTLKFRWNTRHFSRTHNSIYHAITLLIHCVMYALFSAFHEFTFLSFSSSPPLILAIIVQISHRIKSVSAFCNEKWFMTSNNEFSSNFFFHSKTFDFCCEGKRLNHPICIKKLTLNHHVNLCYHEHSLTGSNIYLFSIRIGIYFRFETSSEFHKYPSLNCFQICRQKYCAEKKIARNIPKRNKVLLLA